VGPQSLYGLVTVDVSGGSVRVSADDGSLQG